jgi:hypothetical protein
MGASAVAAQVEKKCYRNQTAGNLGVVKLDHLGAQVGANVVPYGTVWLSDDEAILTARAPALPKDNPFVEQPFMFVDGQGQHVEKPMRPLILIEDARYSPSDERFVPGQIEEEPEAEAVAYAVHLPSVAAAQEDVETALSGDGEDRPVPTEVSAPILVPSSTAAVPPSQARAVPVGDSAPAEPEEDVKDSWVEVSGRTEQPQPGVLRGSNEPAPAPPEGDAAKDGSPQGPPPQQPVRQPVQPPQATSTVEEHASQHGSPVASESAGTGEANGGAIEQAGEEHAAHTASGEETGAAEMPVGEAPKGEFASHEEVGSPDAPTQGAS